VKHSFCLHFKTGPGKGRPAFHPVSAARRSERNPAVVIHNKVSQAPGFAEQAGFDRPILHGLCTFGFAARAILRAAGVGDPARLKSYAVRFMNVVYPGDTLITEGWKVDPGRYIIRTSNQDGKVVLGNGSALIEQ